MISHASAHESVRAAQEWTSAPLQLAREVWLPAEPAALFISLSEPAQMCQIFSWMHQITVVNNDAANTVGLGTVGLGTVGLGTVRRCHFGNGMVLEEVIVGWEPPNWYAYRGIDATHPFGMVGHVGIIECVPAAEGSTLIWKHFFEHSNPTAMVEQLNASVQMAIDSLVQRFSDLPSIEV